MLEGKPHSASTERRRSSLAGARRSSAATDMSAAQIAALQQAVKRARADADTEELLEVVCENNGWSLDGVSQAPHLITALEVFLLNIPRLSIAGLFPNLTIIKLQHVGLESMADLACLTRVEELWVTDNNLTRIEGLDGMTGLKRLFLTGNRITSMDNLPCLKHLKELWLCRNQITAVTHLDRVRKLRSLWLAENPIATLKGAFLGELTKLQEVNLSASQIVAFSEIQRLSVLPCLRAVSFTDPLFGVSPVCQLNNYTTFVLHALPSLDRLDGDAVTGERRATAASIFHKKALYYETRMAALSRNYGLLVNRAYEATRKVMQSSLEATRDLKEVLLPLQYDLTERQMYGGRSLIYQPDSAFPSSALEDAQRELRRAVGTREVEQSTIAKRLAEACGQSRQELEHHMRRLKLELETGGNARLEEVSADDEESWYSSAKELLMTRFDAERFKRAFGIEGVSVQRIFRVHNRGRRLYFDEHVKDLQLDLSEPYNRKRLVCLLSAVPKSAAGQQALTEHILQHGLDAVDSPGAELPGGTASLLAPYVRSAAEGVPLTNSLFLADEGRLRAAEADGSLAGLNRDPNILSGSVVVSRVFLGKNVAALGGRSSSTTAASALGESQAFMTGSGARVWKKDYTPGTFAAYRPLPDDSAIKVWHCFDRALVLPEFVVEYTYVPSKAAPLSSPTQQPLSTLFASPELWREQIAQVLPDVNARDYDDLRDTVTPLMALLRWCGVVKGDGAVGPNTLTQIAQTDTEAALEASDALSAVVQKAEAASTAAPGPLTSALVELYFDALKNPPSPTFCQLRGRRLTAIPADFQSSRFSALTALDVSKNQLASVSWHAIALAAPVLQHLNLSDNQLQCLGLCGSQLPQLLTLDISFNQLDSLDELKQLRTSLPGLETLHAEQNPCFQQKNAECVALSYLFDTNSRIDGLNGIQLTALNRKQCVAMARHDRSLLLDSALSSEEVRHSGSLRLSKDSTSLMDIATVSLQWLVDAVYSRWPKTALSPPPPEHFEDALSGLAAMELPARKKAAYLRNDVTEQAKRHKKTDAGGEEGDRGANAVHTSLSDVSRLCISETLLRTLDWVVMVPNLQSLYLRGNCLDDLGAVLQLTKLEVLDVQDNRLTILPRLCELRHLRELNVSDNQLTTVTCLGGPLKSLTRLHVNSNRLASLDVPLLVACKKLEELYCADNLLDSSKEIAELRQLPHLISIDVCGNPLYDGADPSDATETRQYLVYSLPKLKVLDGQPITPGETQRAQATFAGKLSGDLLSERIREPQSRWGLIKDLDLSHSALREVSLLSAFTSLEVLKLNHNGIVKIDALASLRHLKALNLSHNKLGSTAIGYTGGVLKQIPTLESLSLEANHIQDMAHIALDLPELMFLNLKGNELQFVEHAFDKLPKLREIILDQNRVRALGPNIFASCRQLTALSAEENVLRAIDGVAALTQLTSLSLGANRLADIAQITSDLSHCPLMDAIFIGNPAARKNSYRVTVIAQFPRLARLDSKDISPDERERATAVKNTAYMAPPNVFIDMSYIAAPGGGAAAANGLGAPMVAAAPPNVLPPVQGQLRSMTSNAGGGRGLGQKTVGRGTVRGGGGRRR